MAQKTELQTYALPGQIHSFAAKEAATTNEHTPGGIIQLTPYGLSGKVYSFSAKEAVGVVGYTQCLFIG